MKSKTNARARAGHLTLGLALALSLAGVAATGCGSSGGSSGDGGTGTGGTGGTGLGGGLLTWKDDGTTHTALFATASLARNSGLDYLQVVGADGGGVGIAFGVAMMPPPLTPGSYQCGTTGTGYPIGSSSYTATGVSPSYDSCTITIVAPSLTAGVHVTGTFSAIFPLTSGTAKKNITEGRYDIALTVSGP